MDRLIYTRMTKSDSIEARLLSELEKKFSKKFNDQLFIIEKQRNRLDNQQDQINDQRAIIEELAWQIRDLRDSVRKCSEQMSSKQNVECSESQLKVNIPKTNEPQTGRISFFVKSFLCYKSIIMRCNWE